MGFYNISILKKFLFSLLVVAFIVIALLLMQKSVYAAIYETGFTDSQVQDILATHDNIVNDLGNNFTYWICTLNPGSSAMISFFNSSSDNIVFYANNGYINCTQPVVGHSYLLRGNGTYTDAGSFNANSLANRVGYVDSKLCFYGNVILYANDKSTILWSPDISSLPDMVFENYDDSETYNNSLETGEFTYFYFKVKKNIMWDDVPFPCGFYFHNTTDYTPTNYYDVNYVSSVMLNLNEYTGSESAPNYLYAYKYDSYYYYYALPCTLPLGSYDNNSSYQLDLFYLDTVTEERYTQHYNWTTNFTTAGIAKQEENRQNFRDSVVARYNNMINDLSSNGSIIGDLPDSMYNSVPFNNIIDNIYNLIHDAFTDFDYKEITFNLPHTNQSIVIPSNVMTSRVPTVFLNFLRAFYWYYICKFILYSAYSMFEMVVSGDLINNKSFDVPNVKTKMLG